MTHMRGTSHVLVLVISAIVLERHFLGDFSLPLITGELFGLKKKRRENELVKSFGGRNSLTLRSVLTLDRACEKKNSSIIAIKRTHRNS